MVTRTDDILKMHNDGKSISEISGKTGLSRGAVRERLRRARKKAKAASAEKKEPQFKWEETDILNSLEEREVAFGWAGEAHVRFAIMGDTHLNSKYAQITHLRDFYKYCETNRILDIYHCGDIDEGEQMRQGHQYECHNQGADDHVAFIAKVYPQFPGVKTHFITGNHDASIMKRCGYNIGKTLEYMRKDFSWLGTDRALVDLTPNCKMLLSHPWNGSAYAISYHTQKMIDSMHGGEKPNILAIGHYHKMEQIFYRNIHAFQVGTFQAQTPFMQGKGLSACMGGWIIDICVNSDGTIKAISSEFVPYYTAIKDDWKSYV